MKTKKSVKFRLLALFVCVAVFLPMTFACGEKADGNANATEAPGESETQEQIITDAPTTEAPAPTDPPTTEEPTEPFVVDPNLSYWEQIESELAWYGLEGGTKILNGADEAELMKKLSPNNAKREELDVSADGVPFSAAYRVYTQKEIENFWEAAYSMSFTKDIPTQPDDMIVGVLWIKGKRLEESEKYMADDPAQYYLAIKSPTDNWATEGSMEPGGVQIAEEEWQKVFFCGRVINEEKQSSTMNWNIYMGYGIQEFSIGGVIAYHFPSTAENEKAVINLLY